MKRIAKLILGAGCFLSIILAGCENLDGSCNVIWTLSWMALAVICAHGWKRLEEVK